MQHTGRGFYVPPVVAFWGLFTKYVIILGYGVTGFLVGIPTLQQVTGETFELAWPFLIACLAALSAAGVMVTWWTDRDSFLEYAATLLLVCLLAVYTVALVSRAFLDPSRGTAATAWLPSAFSVFPAIRVAMLQARWMAARNRAKA